MLTFIRVVTLLLEITSFVSVYIRPTILSSRQHGLKYPAILYVLLPGCTAIAYFCQATVLGEWREWRWIVILWLIICAIRLYEVPTWRTEQRR